MGVAAPAIGLGMTAAQGVNSGIKGKQAADQAEQLSQQELAISQGLLNQGQQDLNTIRGANQQFAADPWGTGTGKGAATAAAPTGQRFAGGTQRFYSGGQSQQPTGLRAIEQGLHGTGEQPAQGGTSPIQQIAGAAQGLAGKGAATGMTPGQRLMGLAGQAGDAIAGNAQATAGGMADLLGRAGSGQVDAVQGANFNFQNPQGADFNFNPNFSDPSGQLQALGFYQAQGVNPNQLGATIDQAQAFGDRARATAQDQTAQAFTQSSEGLNAALAGRGISANSGVAAGALSNLAAQGAQGQSQLNRELANQAGQQALQAGQFDVQNTLAGEQLLGNLNLGQNQLQSQNILGASGQNLQQNQLMSQYDLGRAGAQNQFALGAGNLNLGQNQLLNQQNLGLGQLNQNAQNQSFQNALAGAGFDANLLGQMNQTLNQGALAPYQLQQGAYSQNFLNPQLATMGMLNPYGSIGAGMGGISNIGQRYTQGSAAAGAGKGSAKGAVPGILQTFPNASAPTNNYGGGGGGTQVFTQ